jgi:hypothetical protein
MAGIPDGWTEVTNGEWGVGTPRFPENVPVGAHYTNEYKARGVLTPDGVFKIEGVTLDPPNRGKPDGQWWDYVAGEHDQPTDFDPWIEETPAAPAVAAPVPQEPSTEAPFDVPPPLNAPSANPAVVGNPALHITQNADRSWTVRMEHAVGHVFEHVGYDLRALFETARKWVEAHV